MADSDSGSGLAGVLAPWMSSGSPWDPSTYGGAGNFGAAMLSAAGPTPYRVPFGVALGKAMQSGQANALQMARARMGATGDALSMQRSMAMFPYQMAYLQQLAALSGTGGGSPNASSADNTSATSQGTPSDASTATSPASSSANQPAPWVGNAPPPYLAADDSSGPPPSAAPSRAAPSMSAPGTAGVDPFGAMRLAAFGGAMGMPGAGQLSDLGKAQLEYNPGIATNMALAKDPLTLDRTMVAQSLAAGDKQGAQAAYLKFLKDSGQVTVDRYGNVTTLGNINPKDLGVNTFLPAQGMQTSGGVASPIPGILGTRQALAAAEATGKAAGELATVVDPVTHQTYQVPKSVLLGAGAVGGAPGAAAGGAPSTGATGTPGASGPSLPLAALSPGQQGFLRERGAESAKYVTQLQEAADSATTTNYALDQMTAAARGASLGPAAPGREWFENMAAALGQQVGLAPPKELSSYEQLGKYGNQIAFAASRQMGAREAAQIVQLQIQSNPNKALVPEAFAGLTQSMRAMNSYVIAKNTAIQAQSGSDNDSALQAASVWTQRIDPRVWDLESRAATRDEVRRHDRCAEDRNGDSRDVVRGRHCCNP